MVLHDDDGDDGDVGHVGGGADGVVNYHVCATIRV